MRTSDFHETHGLSGYLRSTQTGELIHFRFERGTTKLHMSGIIGEHAVEGFLEVIPRVDLVKDDPLDRELVLNLPGDVAVVPRKHRAHVAKGVGDLTAYDPFKNHPAYQADLQRPQVKDENTAPEIANDRPKTVFDLLDGTQETAEGRPSKTDNSVFPNPREMTPERSRLETKSNEELTIQDHEAEREPLITEPMSDPGVDVSSAVVEQAVETAKVEEKRTGKKGNRR